MLNFNITSFYNLSPGEIPRDQWKEYEDVD